MLLRLFIAMALLVAAPLAAQEIPFRKTNTLKLPDGADFAFWEDQTNYTKVYHVSQAKGSDQNPGTEAKPFKTISKAAQLLAPGEKVVVHQGVYEETVVPKNGGTGPEKMICYEAAKGEEVILQGSVKLEAERFTEEDYYKIKHPKEKGKATTKAYTIDLKGLPFEGYNPFGMMNILHDREWLQHRQQIDMSPHFKKRGQLLIDGKLVEQVETVMEFSKANQFFITHDARKLVLLVDQGFDLKAHTIEATIRETVFCPEVFGLGYIKVKGIHFRRSANGFPVPQKGMLSAMRGHHWIIEDCKFEQANSLAMDLAYQYWKAEKTKPSGGHIVRRNIIQNCGVGGIAGMWADRFLIEDNLLENIGWHIAEPAFESGAIKIHNANSCVIRRNVFRNIVRAPGIWLDFECRNNRVTRNVFTDIVTSRGAVYVEASQHAHEIDHNLFHGLETGFWLSGDAGAGGSALYTDGCDSIHFHHNLCMDIANSGFGAYLNAKRIVSGRGGTMRRCELHHNVFHKCKKYSIDLPNLDHQSYENVFSHTGGGYIHLASPEELFLNLEAWQTYFDKGKKSKKANLDLDFDSKSLTLTWGEHKPMEAAGPLDWDKADNEMLMDPRKLD